MENMNCVEAKIMIIDNRDGSHSSLGMHTLLV